MLFLCLSVFPKSLLLLNFLLSLFLFLMRLKHLIDLRGVRADVGRSARIVTRIAFLEAVPDVYSRALATLGNGESTGPPK